ncbi:hypothetical protein HU200_066457 [Digitaria exilis]|uniref:Ubiquitin-like protease family profile domain-containing protein n=1 Tax=Digitaria exilis TaxID=1010633 RepID=A0A835A268_9POAL|nr:hypothetical protein HU200_066457 [Digitaria exilis]
MLLCFLQVMFPVLQKLVVGDEHSGHYFLIVLNLRNKRFEVFDSMRTLDADKALLDCCMTIITSVKELWKTDYPNTRHPIDDYQLFDVNITKQRNNHDCGYYMLLHAQYWNGRSVCNIQDKDMAAIRKVVTHKWLMYEENDTDWKKILNLV